MSKKYKLLKELPDCEAGAIYHINHAGEHYVCYDNLSRGKWSVVYHKRYVENNPEWFEEIAPIQPAKDYEILAFKILNNIWVRESVDKKYFNVNGRSQFERVHEQELPVDSEIWTIKRISDGEAFSVGNMVYRETDADKKPGLIDKFQIDQHGAMVETGLFRTPFHLIQKPPVQPKPLFTTEDGVDIFDKDAPLIRIDTETGYKIFSTKEAAKAYIKANKPHEEVCGVDIEWEIKSHPTDLGNAMKAEDCRYIGTMQECLDFIKKYKPQPQESFVWTDELVKEMIYQKSGIPEDYSGNVQKMLDDFKQSKFSPQPKEEAKEPEQPKRGRIVVEVHNFYTKTGRTNNGDLFRYYEYSVKNHVPNDNKFPLIKEAIERVLNGDEQQFAPGYINHLSSNTKK